MSQVKKLTNAPRSLFTYVREAREELKKVSWPSRETTIRYTVIVIVSSVVVGLLTGGFDFLLALALEKLIL